MFRPFKWSAYSTPIKQHETFSSFNIFFTLNVFYTSYFIFLPLMSLTSQLVNTTWDPKMCAQSSVIL